MAPGLSLLIFASLFAQNFAELTEKSAIIEVNEENQEEFQVPVGTILILDDRTELYKPPRLSNNFTAKNRYKLMWKNPITQKNYCKVGPSLHRSIFKRMKYSYFYYSWCLSNHKDLCCDNKKCTCKGPGGTDCACLTDAAHAFFEDKKVKDKVLLKGIVSFGVKVIKLMLQTQPTNGELGELGF